MSDRNRKLIFVNGEWMIAVLVPATKYGRFARDVPNGTKVWMDPGDTSLICMEGEARGVADMPPDPV